MLPSVVLCLIYRSWTAAPPSYVNFRSDNYWCTSWWSVCLVEVSSINVFTHKEQINAILGNLNLNDRLCYIWVKITVFVYAVRHRICTFRIRVKTDFSQIQVERGMPYGMKRYVGAGTIKDCREWEKNTDKKTGGGRSLKPVTWASTGEVGFEDEFPKMAEIWNFNFGLNRLKTICMRRSNWMVKNSNLKMICWFHGINIPDFLGFY